MKRPLVVVDNNIFISALIRPRSNPGKLTASLRKGEFRLITSELLLQELEEVLKREKYNDKYGISMQIREQLIAELRGVARVLPVLDEPSFNVRDAKDEMVLATGIEGEANYLVTGDKDLLVLNSDRLIGKLKIVTVEQFLKEIK